MGSVSKASLWYAVLKTLLRERGEAAAGVSSAGGSGSICFRIISGISMQSRQQVSHTEEREHHNCESQHREVGGTPPSPSACDAHVQIAGIVEPSKPHPR